MKTPEKFHLLLGAPTVLAQGAVGDQAWGHYQFPKLHRTAKGHVFAAWEYGNDSLDYDAVLHDAVSEDGGKTWRPVEEADRIYGIRMANGKYFGGFVGMGAHPVDYMDPFTPAGTGRGVTVYFAEDLGQKEETVVRASEIDPATGVRREFTCTVHWPNMPATLHAGNRLYPVTQIFALSAETAITPVGDELYFCLYTTGLDSEAKTRDKAAPKHLGFNNVYVFKSSDCARTWEYLSQVLVDEKTFSPLSQFEGLDEPMMAEMPDGSFIMLIRSGNGQPSYLVRSTDRCRSWSAPVQFDDIGVLPQLLRLDCGVTLASYGRPELRVRATADPAGLVWEKPITVDLYGMKMPHFINRSCFYTDMLPLDSHTALLIYTDFQYPNEDGVGVKTVLTRTITVAAD